MLASIWMTRHRLYGTVANSTFRLVPPSSLLYQLVLDHLVATLRVSPGEDYWVAYQSYPKQVLIDIMRRNAICDPEFEGPRACFQSVCHYHDHEEDGEEGRKKCQKMIEGGANVHSGYHGSLSQQDWEWDW